VNIAGNQKIRRNVSKTPPGLLTSCTLIYLVVAIAWSWPLPLHLTNRFTHDPGDPLLITYLLWWNAHAVPLTAAYWNAPYYWPMRDALALTDHLAGLSPITTPLQWLGASPLTAYNLLLIAATWWSGLATHAVVRRLGGSNAAAYCSGVAFAYAPYRTSQLGHLQIYACWWLPLMLLALHGYDEQRRVRWLVLLGASWALQGLTNGCFLLFAPVLIGCWLLWFTRRGELRGAGRVLLTLGLSALPVLPFLLKYRAVQNAQGLTRTAGEMAAYSAKANSFLSATPILRFWHTRPPFTTEHYLFPGITALALTIGGLIVAHRDRRLQFYVAAAILMTLLCAGPAWPTGSLAVLWHPYTWLTWIPGFGGLRVPSRFFMLTALCLAIAAGLSFDALGARLGKWRTAFATLVFAGLAVDGAIAGMPLGVPPSQFGMREAGARVIALPYEDGRVSVFAMYQSMARRLAVVNGYSGYVPSYGDVLQWALGRRDPTVLTELRRGHPLYVLVASTDRTETWTQFMDAQPDAELLGIEGGGRLYRMSPAPYAHESRAGVAIADAAIAVAPDWITADLGRVQAVRGLDLRIHGNLVRLPATLLVQTSEDGARWTAAFDDRPGGLTMTGALAWPQVIPLHVDLLDVPARYVRVNAPAFGPRAITIYRP
jgi:hypothetical protein